MTISTDFCGCDTKLSQAALAPWNRTIRGFLAHAADTPTHLARTLDLAPDFALGHAAKGLFCLLLARAEMTETARQALAAAQAGTAGTVREQAYVVALDVWLSGAPSRAVATLETVLAAEPRDALAMKLVQAIQFMLGKPGEMRASLERILPEWSGHPALGYLKGCHAFTLEETGDYAAAETAGREGLLLAPDDAWGLHAVAHVYDMTARAGDGLTWLGKRRTAWEHCNNFRFHVWWHMALMHLDLGQIDEVFALYDSEIRREKTDDFRDISNGASLLCRLELDGYDVGDRWEELADISERRTSDGCLAFADLHYLLSLIGDKRRGGIETLLTRMAADAQTRDSEARQIMARPGLTEAQGLEAYGEGAYAEAFVNLMAGRKDLQSIGGSHAQRDVFERLTIEAALRSGYLDRAEALLQERTAKRGGMRDGYTERRLDLIAATRSPEPSKLSLPGA